MASKLERYLAKELYTRFGHLRTRQNYRPDWLEGLELDFYIDELNLAAEIQGEQHYRFVPHFHRTRDNFEQQQDRDAKKSLICRQRGIRLVEIYTETDADIFVKSIIEKIKPPKYHYSDEGEYPLYPSDKLSKDLRKARRAIRKNGNKQVVQKRIMKLVDKCKKENFVLTDQDVLDYCRENKIDLEIKICKECDRKFYSSSAIQAHIEAVH